MSGNFQQQATFNVSYQLGGLASLALNSEMVRVLISELDHCNVEVMDDDHPVIKNLREILSMQAGTDNELMGFSGALAASVLVNEFPDGRVEDTLVVTMNYTARMALADFIEDHDSEVGAVRAMVNALRHPGDKLTPRQRHLVTQNLNKLVDVLRNNVESFSESMRDSLDNLIDPEAPHRPQRRRLPAMSERG